MAEEVEAKRLTTEVVGTRGQECAVDANQAVGERLLALVEPYPGSQRLVRRAWRSAQRLGADARPAVGRAPATPPTPRRSGPFTALRELASVLGAQLSIEESDDLAAAVARGGARAGQHLHPARGARARPAASRGCASRCRSG